MFPVKAKKTCAVEASYLLPFISDSYVKLCLLYVKSRPVYTFGNEYHYLFFLSNAFGKMCFCYNRPSML